jgi:hypothetical protein
MAGSDPYPGGKLWVMPAILELFALPFAWIAVQMLHDHEPWNAILKYGVAGVALCITGIAWSVFRKRIAKLWPWHQLRAVRDELVQVSQENSELRKRLDIPKEMIALPAPKQGRLVKPQHNVQCVGFNVFDDHDGTPVTVTLCFQNVRSSPDQLIGKFEWPRLGVVYYDNSTGQEIGDLCPLLWWDSECRPEEINASVSHAIIASQFKRGVESLRRK